MTDNEKRAHDIAISLLPRSLNETSSEIFIFDNNGNGKVNAVAIIDSYMELYLEALNELNSL